MADNNNTTIARNIYESYNRRDFDSAVKHVDTNAQLHNIPANTVLRGQDGFRQFMKAWDTAFPDSKCDIKNVYGAEDFVVVEFHGVGTHKGILKTPDGEIQPTGKRVDVPFCDLINFKNGKIIKSTSYYDLATFMKQLGVFPEQKLHA